MPYLLDAIEQEDSLRTFLLGAKLASLIDTYLSAKSTGKHTIFVPVDATFNQDWAPQAAFSLLKEPQKLADLLKRHIVEGSLSIESMAANSSIKSCDNTSITFDSKDNTVNKANILKSIPCDNGMIHIIDKVFATPEDL
ncbi:MAG: sensory subunit of low CO2-induced protein complex [Chlamydiales bacterium]|nr:sensory subunit of low CO2-induced protein complex [Chlamydiales bacterium]